MATFEAGLQQGYTLTEAEMKPLWNQVLNSYRQAYSEIDNELAKTYAKYLEGVDPDDYYNTMIKFDRLGTLQKEVATIYKSEATAAGKSTALSSQVAMTNNFYRQQYTMSWFADNGFSFIDQRLVNASVFGTEEIYKQIQSTAVRRVIETKYGDIKQYFPQTGSLTDLLQRHATEDIAKIKQAITSGLIQGKSYSKVTDDVKGIIGLELAKNGNRTYTGAKANAARIVRTEGTRNLNNAALANMYDVQAQGIQVEKMWDATLDARTRATHGAEDGTSIPLDGLFYVGSASGPAPGQMSTVTENVNCRCSLTSLVDGVKPEARRGRNPDTGETEVFSYKSFDAWAKDNGLTRNSAGVLVKK